MKNKLIVPSMDAMVGENVEYLYTKPYFSRLMNDSSGVKHVRTIYPSITYPAHASIATGCRPGKSGVYANTRWSTKSSKFVDWYHESDILEVEDIFAAAKRVGCSTASVYWPTCGGNRNIDYLINEYFFPFPEEGILEGFSKFGANEVALSVVKENLDRFPKSFRLKPKEGKLGLEHLFDDFINGCMCSMIRNVQPDVLLVHNCIMDSWSHRYGISHPYIYEALDQVDLWFGEIIDAIESVGKLEDYNIVVLSDHGQMNFARKIKLNMILARGKLIDLDSQGNVTGWKAFAQSNGMSASIYLKDPDDKKVWGEVYDYLIMLCNQGVWGFEKVWTADEIKEKYGTWGKFSFIVETDGITAFSEGWTEPMVEPITYNNDHISNASHGYQPEKGPQPFFLCTGPAFKRRVMIPDAFIIDEAPTLARVLGTSMPQAEGRVLKELLV